MEAFSIVVRTLMACCVTILDLARLGSGVYVVGAFLCPLGTQLYKLCVIFYSVDRWDLSRRVVPCDAAM
jgi:hypothetical protein